MKREDERPLSSQDATALPRSEFIETGAMRFEVETCGDPESRRLALCLHGFPELATSWRHQMPLLARHGYKVWAPNQRGYGRTTRPPGVESYAMECLLDDVAHLIDASGCDEVTLIGHDWGGAVAWAAALTEIRPIERLVVMNLPHPAIFFEHVRRWRQLRRSWYMLFMQIPWLPEKLFTASDARVIGEAFRGSAIDKSRFDDDLLDVYRRAALAPGAMTAMINWYRAAFRAGLRGEGVLRDLRTAPRLATPTLMLWGEEDIALGKELTVGTEDLVDDFTLRTLPGVSHWVQQEAPEAVNAMLDAWLKGEPVPEASWGGRLKPTLTAGGAADAASVAAGSAGARTARTGTREPHLTGHLRQRTGTPVALVELVKYADPEAGRVRHRVDLARLGGRLVFAAHVDCLLVGDPDDTEWDDLLVTEYASGWDLMARLEAPEDGPAESLRARRVVTARPAPLRTRASIKAGFWAMRRFGAAAPIPWAGADDVIATLENRNAEARPDLGPTAEQIRAFAKTPIESPVVMLNLLGFAETARYGQALPERAPVSGRAAYAEYGRGVARLIAQSGGRIRWMGAAQASFDARDGDHDFVPAVDAWDEVVAVEYPSRSAFLSMIASAAYAAHSPHRDAGLSATRLLATTPWPEFA